MMAAVTLRGGRRHLRAGEFVHGRLRRFVVASVVSVGVLGAVGLLPAPTSRVAVRPVAGTVKTLTIAAIGDTILGNTPNLPSDPRHYFSGIGRQLRNGTQLVFANLEGTLTTQSHSKCGPSSSNCFAFRNPPSFANAFAAAGFTVLNDANNHSHDFGQAGLDQTVSSIHAAGMAQTGLPHQVTYVKAAGLRVAVLGFAPYGDTANMLDLSTAADMIRRAHRHADVVMVYMHAGAEGSNADHVTGQEEYYLGEDRGNAQRFAHLAIRSGASLVIGSGPHVLRGMEFYRRHLIAYSLANSANYHNFSNSGVLADSAVLRVTLAPSGAFRTGQLISVRLADAGRPTLGGDSISFVRRLSKDDFGTHAARLSRHGVIRRPA
ncbi:MAG: hypothetical protein QOF18_3083 [Frankiaceae bacterium]|nr:hypothetical protein [Frankiaceae bacterium]